MSKEEAGDAGAVLPAWVRIMAGEWSRVRLWGFYGAYFVYFFLHDAWETLGVVLAFEAINLVARYVAVRHPLDMNPTTAWLAVDAGVRLVTAFAGVFLAVFIAWIVDLSRIKGMVDLTLMWVAASFVIARETTHMRGDYAILPVHLFFFGTLSETAIFAGPAGYLVLGAYALSVLAMIGASEKIGMLAVLPFLGGWAIFLLAFGLTTDRKMPLSYYVNPSRMDEI